jgi:hypothetical protein
MSLKLKLAQEANPNTLDDGRPIEPGQEFVVEGRDLTVRERQLLIDGTLILLSGEVADAPTPAELTAASSDTAETDNTNSAPVPPKAEPRARGGKS